MHNTRRITRNAIYTITVL